MRLPKYLLWCDADAIIDVHAQMRGGVPVLSRTRFPVARVFAEIADNQAIGAIAEDYDLDPGVLKQLFQKLAQFFDRSFAAR